MACGRDIAHNSHGWLKYIKDSSAHLFLDVNFASTPAFVEVREHQNPDKYDGGELVAHRKSEGGVEMVNFFMKDGTPMTRGDGVWVPAGKGNTVCAAPPANAADDGTVAGGN